MRTAAANRVASTLALFAGSACLLTIVVFSTAIPPGAAQPAQTLAPNSNATADPAKLAAEIAKLQAETAALRSIGDRTRWWTTVLTAIGSIIGAIVGGIFTFVITKMAQRFTRLQQDLEDSRSERDRLRREDDEKLARQKMRQEQEQAQELHNLRLFQDLGHQSHRARLAAAAVLLDRLRRLQEVTSTELQEVTSIESETAGTAQLIGKVLVAVLKRQATAIEKPTSGLFADENGTAPAIGITVESDASLRKYIADELVQVLGVRFNPGKGPKELGKSPLGQDRDFQKCDLADVYWAYIDGRGIDFFQSDLTQASLRGAALQEAVFYEASLRNAILREADLRKANLIGCDLRDADLRNADLSGANLQGANLVGADLRGTNLKDAVINIEAILRFRPTALPQETDSSGTHVMSDVYRPAS
jgi:uncharacterized protein YjbI with pentapeptide repeats